MVLAAALLSFDHGVFRDHSQPLVIEAGRGSMWLRSSCRVCIILLKTFLSMSDLLIAVAMCRVRISFNLWANCMWWWRISK